VVDVLTLMSISASSSSAIFTCSRANRRNSARLPLYLAAGWVRSNPPIIVVPWRSQTRHSHLVGLRLVINTSNTAPTASPVVYHLKHTRLDPTVRLPESPVS
jgi:hypothetical protein